MARPRPLRLFFSPGLMGKKTRQSSERQVSTSFARSTKTASPAGRCSRQSTRASLGESGGRTRRRSARSRNKPESIAREYGLCPMASGTSCGRFARRPAGNHRLRSAPRTAAGSPPARAPTARWRRHSGRPGRDHGVGRRYRCDDECGPPFALRASSSLAGPLNHRRNALTNLVKVPYGRRAAVRVDRSCPLRTTTTHAPVARTLTHRGGAGAVDARVPDRSTLAVDVLDRDKDAPVAQMDRASASGAEGHRFESCRARQLCSSLATL